MKNTMMIIILVALVSLGAYAQHDQCKHDKNCKHEHCNHNHDAEKKEAQQTQSPSFKNEKISIAYSHYINLKDALVASNTEEITKTANELKKSLSEIPNASKASTENDKLIASSNITEQRKVFSSLSNEITKLIKANKISSGSVYLAYCPMANNNEGAYWLANEKEIKNPYFGDVMLTCGSVKETLK
jgi:hypothetical protein